MSIVDLEKMAETLNEELSIFLEQTSCQCLIPC